METMVKINVEKMKIDIKDLVEKQKFLRNQRKTVHILGDRKIPAWQATFEHQINGNKLRILYAAYGLARGKSFSYTENHYPEDNHPLNEFKYDIDKIITSYSIQEE